LHSAVSQSLSAQLFFTGTLTYAAPITGFPVTIVNPEVDLEGDDEQAGTLLSGGGGTAAAPGGGSTVLALDLSAAKVRTLAGGSTQITNIVPWVSTSGLFPGCPATNGSQASRPFGTLAITVQTAYAAQVTVRGRSITLKLGTSAPATAAKTAVKLVTGPGDHVVATGRLSGRTARLTFRAGVRRLPTGPFSLVGASAASPVALPLVLDR
jgi:hypothetical protein